jgi:hypothetical protein
VRADRAAQADARRSSAKAVHRDQYVFTDKYFPIPLYERIQAMRTLHLAITVALVAVCATAIRAQEQATGAGQSPAQAVMDRAAAAQKYVFLFFWKDKNPQTDRAWRVLEPAVTGMAGSAEAVSIQITDPAEKRIVDKYSVTRAPMPLVLAIAPCGAITKALTKTFDERQLRTAFVSTCTQQCLKALQDRKLVLACVVDQTNPQDPVTIPRGVEDFRADAKLGPATEVILVNARDQSETGFLNEFQVDRQSPKPVVVFLAPPGSMIGKFDGAATKQELVAKLISAQSNPCAGGKCGPGGCCPKK